MDWGNIRNLSEYILTLIHILWYWSVGRITWMILTSFSLSSISSDTVVWEELQGWPLLHFHSHPYPMILEYGKSHNNDPCFIFIHILWYWRMGRNTSMILALTLIQILWSCSVQSITWSFLHSHSHPYPLILECRELQVWSLLNSHSHPHPLTLESGKNYMDDLCFILTPSHILCLILEC